MASKVNTKFVLVLAGVLGVLVLGTGGILVLVTLRGPERNAAMGDEAMAAGEYKLASELYGRAVSKTHQQDLGYLKKYLEALELYVPESQTLYEDQWRKYMGTVHSYAQIAGADVEAQERSLRLSSELARLSDNIRAWKDLRTQAEDALRLFDEGSPEGWERLKRYSGIAMSNIALTGERELPEDDVPTMIEHLTAALEADPSDAGAALALAEWHTESGRRLLGRDQREEAESEFDRAVGVMQSFMENNPGDPRGLLYRLAFVINRDLAFAPAGGETGVREALAGRIDEAMTKLEESPPEHLDIHTLGLAERIERRLLGSTSSTNRLIEKAAKSVDNVMILSYYAQMLRVEGKPLRAMEVYKQILDLPKLPLGFDGFIREHVRQQAAMGRFDSAIDAWEKAQGEEDQGAAKERAIEFRADLNEWFAPGANELMLSDAKIAMLERQWGEAQRLLVEHNRVTSDMNPSAVFLEALVRQERGSPGAAAVRLRQLVELHPSHVLARMLLGNLEAQLGDYAAALTQYQRVLELVPNHPAALERAEQIAALYMKVDSDDPVHNATHEARQKALGTIPGASGPDRAGAAADLRKKIDAGLTHPDLFVLKSEIEYELGDMAAVIATIEEGLSHNPDDARLLERQKVFTPTTPEEVRARIGEGGPDVQPLRAQLYNMYQARGMEDEMARLAEEARAADPEFTQPTTAPLLFYEALRTESFADAASIVKVAERTNADGMKGMYYLARLRYAEGKVQEAIQTLERAAADSQAQPESLRFLGVMLREQGRTSESISWLERAYQEGSRDPATVNEYLNALIMEGRFAEGLRVARECVQLAGRNQVFTDMWLGLEAISGDKQLAIERREQMVRQQPENVGNKLALVNLYIQTKAFEKAKAVIDQVRAAEDSLRVVEAQTRLAMAQGQMEAARQTLSEYVARLERDGTLTRPEPLIMYGDFLVQIGDVEGGVAQIERAKSLTSDHRQLDLRIGEALVNAGKAEAAVEPLKRSLDAASGQAEESRALLLYAEALRRLGRIEDAESAIMSASAEAREMLPIRLIHAQVVRAAGDEPRADEMLDAAITASPNEPAPYIERAKVFMHDPDMRPRAILDLTSAITRDPGNWRAFVLRADVKSLMGDKEGRINDLRQALRLNPMLDEQVRNVVITGLISLGQATTAGTVAREAAEARPGDAEVRLSLAQIFAAHEMWDQASAYMGSAYEIRPEPEIAERYAYSLLQQRTPNVSEASRVLAAAGSTPSGRTPHWYMTNAMLLQKQGQRDRARAEIATAFALCGDDPLVARTTTRRLVELIPDTAERIAFVERIDLSRLPDRWSDYIKTTTRSQDPALRDRVIDDLGSIADTTQSDILRVNVHIQLGGMLVEDERFEEAEEVMRKGLELYPDTVQLNNNLAYMLAHNLDRPGEGIPLAEKAVELLPIATIYDTLGYVYMKAGRYEDGLAALRTALSLSNSDNDKVTSLLHLSELHIARGQTEEAGELLDEASGVILSSSTLDESLEARYSKLQEELDALPTR